MEKLSEANGNPEAVREQLLVNYALLSDMFFYPQDATYKQKIKNIFDYLGEVNAAAANAMQPFISYMEQASVEELQELFLRSFDLQAITTLDIGFVLFGEDYKRGKLLVHLNQEHSEAGNECHTELSDHLPNVLNLIAKMQNTETRDEIASRLILPAVDKMIREFTVEKIDKKDAVYKKHQKILLEFSKSYRTMYLHLLEALFIVMRNDFDYVPENYEELIKNAGNSDSERPAFLDGKKDISTKETKDFAENIETEMLTEKE